MQASTTVPLHLSGISSSYPNCRFEGFHKRQTGALWPIRKPFENSQLESLKNAPNLEISKCKEQSNEFKPHSSRKFQRKIPHRGCFLGLQITRSESGSSERRNSESQERFSSERMHNPGRTCGTGTWSGENVY